MENSLRNADFSALSFKQENRILFIGICPKPQGRHAAFPIHLPVARMTIKKTFEKIPGFLENMTETFTSCT